MNAYWSGNWSGDVAPSNSNFEACFHLAKILEYVECPQYLRKRLFPFHKALKYAGKDLFIWISFVEVRAFHSSFVRITLHANFPGLLNPLDANHHLKSDDLSVRFREGVILDKPIRKGRGPLVDIGLEKVSFGIVF